MKKKKKTYSVNVAMTWSMEYTVRATTKAEAKRIAWNRFKRNPPKRCFEILAYKKDLD